MGGVILLLSWLFITSLCGIQAIEVPVGEFFWQELTPQFFNFTYSTDELPNIHYSVSSQPFAGLPAWLSFYQRNSSSPGIVYGTPTFADVGKIDVQVIALNRELFDSVEVIISLDVTEQTPQTEYSIDLFVTNTNFDSLLMGTALANFTSIMQSIVQSENLLVENVTHPTFRGDSLPLPTGDRRYEGVYVVFGNVVQDYDRASSGDIMNIMESCTQDDVDLSNLPLHYRLTLNFDVDWCKMNFTKKVSATTPGTEPTADTISGVDDSAERNTAIVISFLILFAIVVIIIFVLVIVCYNRYQAWQRVDESGKQYRRQDIWKSTQSMVIANAQLELREMSSPPPDKPSHTTPSPSLSRPSLVDTQGEMMTSPPYEYPRHLTSMTRMPESELTLEPATASTVL